MSDEMVAAQIAKERAHLVVHALYICGSTLADLQPESRLIVLRALCATFLTSADDDVPPESKR